MIHYILLCGAAGAGKSTASGYIADYLQAQGKTVIQEALANPLKKMVQYAFPLFKNEDLYGPSEKRSTPYAEYKRSQYGNCPVCNAEMRPLMDWSRCRRCHHEAPSTITPRYALQTLGTEWGRRLDKDIWCKALKARAEINPIIVYDTYILVSDVRFVNELRFFKSQELLSDFPRVCSTIFLTRNLPEKGAKKLHASEKAVLQTSKSSLLDCKIDNATYESPEQLREPLTNFIAQATRVE